MRRLFWTGIGMCAALVAAFAHPVAAGHKLPDLVEARVNVSDHDVRPGDRVTVTDVGLNRGRARSGASVTEYWLTIFPCLHTQPMCLPPYIRGTDASLGSRNVRSLRPGRRSLGRRGVEIPKMKPGTYYLVGCADAKSAVDESSERNNCRVTRHRVRLRGRPGDHTAPQFAGLQSAVTCIGGPVGGGRKSSYHLKWKAATDNRTPQSAIVYDVFQATKPGGEDFAHPTYTSDPGTTSYTTPPLSSDVTYYFIVRARDRAGNRDQNKVEREGENLCV